MDIQGQKKTRLSGRKKRHGFQGAKKTRRFRAQKIELRALIYRALKHFP